jgi:hypothetical protein
MYYHHQVLLQFFNLEILNLWYWQNFLKEIIFKIIGLNLAQKLEFTIHFIFLIDYCFNGLV